MNLIEWFKMLLQMKLKMALKKRKERKREFEHKSTFKSCKIYFWELTQNCSFLFELKKCILNRV